MTLQYLDVSRLPTSQFVGEGEARFNIATIPMALEATVKSLARRRLIKANPSFGFAAATPTTDLLHEWDWDDPYSFVWLVAGWGKDRDRYIANAVRKLRAALREDMDTLELRIRKPGAFRDVIDTKDDDGNFPWGDFPWGGATFVRVGDWVIPSSASALFEVEDDFVSKMHGGMIGAQMVRALNLAEFGPNS